MAESKDARFSFALLCLIGFATFFGSYLRIPVLPLYASTLGATPYQVGMINGAFMLSAGLLSIPAGLLSDRAGRKLPIVTGIITVAASSFLVSQSAQPIHIAGAYVLFGGGLAAFAPAMLSTVADVVPGDRLGKAYGWYTTAIYCAMTVGPAVGGFMGKHLGLRQVFFVSGGLLVLVAVLALPVIPGSGSHRKSDVHSLLSASMSLLSNSGLRGCLMATLGSCLGFGFFLTFLPLYAASRGLDAAQVGLVFASQALTNVLIRVPLGRLADRVERRRLAAGGLICLCMALTALGHVARLELMMGCAVLLGVGMALIYTTVGALIVELVPATERGLAMGMYNSCIYLGMMSGSAGIGAAVGSIGYPGGFGVAGGVAVIVMFRFRVVMRRRG